MKKNVTTPSSGRYEAGTEILNAAPKLCLLRAAFYIWDFEIQEKYFKIFHRETE